MILCGNGLQLADMLVLWVEDPLWALMKHP
jgi:hypothetical protein